MGLGGGGAPGGRPRPHPPPPQKENNRMKKIFKYILIGIAIYVAVLIIEIGCLYAVQGDNIWNYLREVWDWYKALF